MIISYWICDRCGERLHEDDVPGSTYINRATPELKENGSWYWSIDTGDICNDCWRKE